MEDDGVRLRQHFRAPWDGRVKVVTFGFLALAALAVLTTGSTVALPVVVIACLVAAFGVRGYSVVDGTLYVHRLGWSTKFDLSKLRRVEASPGITMGSIRAFGNGGLFGFVGYFRNEIIGMYKAYATDGMRAVLLEFPDLKVVVTPDSPAEFVEAVRDGANLPEPTNRAPQDSSGTVHRATGSPSGHRA